MKKRFFIVGVISTFAVASFANLPRSGHTSGSMATQSDVSEIRAKRHADLSFDADLKRLSSLQGRYRENLPVRAKHQTRSHTAKNVKPRLSRSHL